MAYRQTMVAALVVGVVMGMLGLVWAAPPSASKAAPAKAATSATSVASAAPATSAVKAETSAPPAFEPDLGAFMVELIKTDQRDKTMQMLIWLPQEYFVQSAMAQGDTTREQGAKIMSSLAPYIVVMVHRGPLASSDPDEQADEAAIRANVRIVAKDGTRAVALDKTPTDVEALVAAMATAMNRMTPNIRFHVLIFQNKDGQGKPIIDELRRDKLTVAFGETDDYPAVTFAYRTPFDAASPPLKCAACGEPVSPKWSYCPWCGKRLPAKK